MGKSKHLSRQIHQAGKELDAPQTAKSFVLDGDSVDQLQFGASISYALEASGHVDIDVIRIGRLQGVARVKYQTFDSHAKAGKHYVYTEGELTFQPGEAIQTFKVQLLPENKIWSPSVEFKIELHSPTGHCKLGNTHHTCRVKFVTKHYFPTDRYKDKFEKDPPERVAGMFLIWEYLRFNMREEGMQWRMITLFVLSQAHNLQWILNMQLNIYMLDVLFKADDDEARGLWLPSRQKTAILLGLLYVVPFAALHFVDWLEVKMRTRNRAEKVLQLAIFRHFMNYPEEATADIHAADLNMMILSDVPELVHNAFLVLMPMLKFLGKITMVTYFIFFKNRNALWALIVWPTILISFVLARYQTLLDIGDEKDELKKKVNNLVTEATDNFGLIADYNQRPRLNHIYEMFVNDLHEGKVRESTEEIHNHYASPWLGILFMGFYVAIGCRSVFDGALSVGAFVTTIHVFKDVGSECKELYKRVYEMCMSTGPLRDIIDVLNFATDLPREAKEHQLSRENMRQRASSHTDRATSVFDVTPINCDNVSFRYKKDGRDILKRVTINVPQGHLVAIVGDKNSGKGTLLRLLSGMVTPREGEGITWSPPHLRKLFVPQQPALIRPLSCYENITFGLPGDVQNSDKMWDLVERVAKRMAAIRDRRVLEILSKERKANELLKQRLAGGDEVSVPVACDCGFTPLVQTLDKPSMADMKHADYLGLLEEAGETDAWSKGLSYTDLVLLHLTRAFIMNPEFLTIERPAAAFERTDERLSVIELLRDFVDSRGLEHPKDTQRSRRPRTCCFTTMKWTGTHLADEVWEIKEGQLTKLSSEEREQRIDAEIASEKKIMTERLAC